MPEKYYITPVGDDEPVDPGYGIPGGKPKPPHVGGGPIVLPPLPGVWPPAGHPSLPIELPPGHVELPIYIPGSPEKPINLPPGTIWPPLPPKFPVDPNYGVEAPPPTIGGGPVTPPPQVGGGPIVHDKYAILIFVLGVGYRWFIYDQGAAVTPPIANPPKPQPK